MRRAAVRPGQAGFTLVELLVALLLFSLLAAAATALTAGATRSLLASDSALAELDGVTRTRAILAADLGQAAQRPSRGADGALLQAFTLTPDGFVFVRRGLSGVLPNVQKVAWGFDGERLLRQTFPAVDGAEPGPATVMVDGVTDVRLRVAGPEGWQDGWSPRRPERLPRALELTLARANGPPVTLIVAVAG
jgi:general secretion pathway protein J